MKKQIYYLLCGLLGIIMVTLVVVLPQQATAQTPAPEINLVTGNEAGEYYSIGQDLEKLALENNLDINVIPTRGALQNIHDVFHYESIPLGITQSDLLAFLNTFANNDEIFRQQAEAVRVLLPLYKEEVHLIARQEINSVEDLEGKRVSIGEAGSGTSTTASTLLYQLEIKPDELLVFDVRKSINALRNGEIDAMFYVVGMPAKVLEEEISSEDNLHLLPLALPPKPDDEFFSKLYSPITIPSQTYSWQTESVETLAVESLLFTVVDQDCESVTPVVKLIKNNLSWLAENGDPVWKEVSLENANFVTGERLSSCAVF